MCCLSGNSEARYVLGRKDVADNVLNAQKTGQWCTLFCAWWKLHFKGFGEVSNLSQITHAWKLLTLGNFSASSARTSLISCDDPYHEGWLYMLDTENLALELGGLYSGRECFQWMERENQNLHKLMGPRYEKMVAVGGEPIDDIYGNLPEVNWYRLVSKFLQTGIKQ